MCETKQGGLGWSDLQQEDAVGRNALDVNPTDWPVYRSEIVIIHLPQRQGCCRKVNSEGVGYGRAKKTSTFNEIGHPSRDYRQSELGASGHAMPRRDTPKISADYW